jgi:DNA-binding transcriptional LysR family regulator
MDLSRLLNFVSVVEEGSIGRAASSLHVAQPALSRQIRLLEEEIGLVLFERLPRGIRLTPGGQEFLTGVRRLLKESEDIVQNAIHASRGEFGNFALGVSEFYAFHPDVLAAIRTYKTQYPGIRFRLAPLLSGDIMQQIEADQLDGGFVLGVPRSKEMFQTLPLLKERLLLAVSAGSELAKRGSCSLSVLHESDLILVPREQSPGFYDRMTRYLRERHISPRIMLEGSNHSAIMALVASGLGCAFVPSTARFTTTPAISLIEIVDCDIEISIEFVWKTQNPSATLSRFVEVMRRTWPGGDKTPPAGRQ